MPCFMLALRRARVNGEREVCGEGGCNTLTPDFEGNS